MKTESQVIRFVQNNTKHFSLGFKLPNHNNGGKYAVEYDGRVYHSDDIRELVEMICNDLEIVF